MATFRFFEGSLADDLKRLDMAVHKAVSKKSLYEGAKVQMEALRGEILAIPEEPYRFVVEDKLRSATAAEKKGLLDNLGIAKMEQTNDGWQTSVGVNGYNKTKTKTYPNGQPNAMIARSINAGSYVRERYAFIDKAKRKAKNDVEKAMERTAEQEIDRVLN